MPLMLKEDRFGFRIAPAILPLKIFRKWWGCICRLNKKKSFEIPFGIIIVFSLFSKFYFKQAG
jgi:hypothetical protein